MFEVVNVFLADEKVLKSRLRDKKIKEVAPDAEIKLHPVTGRYYICLGTYGELSIAQIKSKEFRRKGIMAGVLTNDTK